MLKNNFKIVETFIINIIKNVLKNGSCGLIIGTFKLCTDNTRSG